MSKSHVVALVPLLVAVTLLSGCAPATVAPTSSPSSEASSAPTATPTPTVAPASAAGPRVQLKCASLYSVDAVATLINAKPTIASDETTAPKYLDDVANAQLGTLTCYWYGPDGADGAASEALTIDIAPDSAAAYAQYAAQDLKPLNGGKSFASTAGDQSGLWCSAKYGAYCDAQMLVGSYWVTVELNADNPNVTTNPTISTLAKSTSDVLTNVAAQLAAAPAPAPEWVSPATTPPAFCSAPTSTAKVRGIFGVLTYTPFPVGKATVDASSVAQVGRAAACDWSAKTGSAGALDIELLAGGSWVFPGFAPVPPADGYIRSYSPYTVAGASSAVLGCASGGCEGYFAIGTTLAHITIWDQGAAKNKTHLAALIAAIAAS